MVGAVMATKFSAPKDQRFECRDCPARCCRLPWAIKFSSEEVDRYLAEPWVQERAQVEGLNVLARGILPMREHERRLQCIFLDDDQMCGMQKQFGHSYIPRACQAFPFGFMHNEKGEVVAQLSQLCPSIRENYGKPVDKQLKLKVKQKGDIERMTTAMSSLGRVLLSQNQYLQVARAWAAELRKDLSPTDILAHLYDRMMVFDQALPTGSERVANKAIESALERSKDTLLEPLEPLARPSFHARALYSYLLGNLCYPARVRQPHRVFGGGGLQGVRALFGKWAWLRQRGTVDMLFVEEPFRLQRVGAVKRFLDQPTGAQIRDYLLLTIQRRQLFATPRYIHDPIIDMSLATVLISRFARCKAAADGRNTVTPADVREGISVAELVLVSHVALADEGKTMSNLRVLMLSSRDKLRALLASEA